MRYTNQGLALLLVPALLVVGACGGGDDEPSQADARSPSVDATVDAREGFWLTGTVRAATGAVPASGKLVAG